MGWLDEVRKIASDLRHSADKGGDELHGEVHSAADRLDSLEPDGDATGGVGTVTGSPSVQPPLDTSGIAYAAAQPLSGVNPAPGGSANIRGSVPPPPGVTVPGHEDYAAQASGAGLRPGDPRTGIEAQGGPNPDAIAAGQADVADLQGQVAEGGGHTAEELAVADPGVPSVTAEQSVAGIADLDSDEAQDVIAADQAATVEEPSPSAAPPPTGDLYLYTGSTPTTIDTDVWPTADVQTNEATPRYLHTFTGDGVYTGADWELYTGATQPLEV